MDRRNHDVTLKYVYRNPVEYTLKLENEENEYYYYYYYIIKYVLLFFYYFYYI